MLNQSNIAIPLVSTIQLVRRLSKDFLFVIYIGIQRHDPFDPYPLFTSTLSPTPRLHQPTVRPLLAVFMELRTMARCLPPKPRASRGVIKFLGCARPRTSRSILSNAKMSTPTGGQRGKSCVIGSKIIRHQHRVAQRPISKTTMMHLNGSSFRWYLPPPILLGPQAMPRGKPMSGKKSTRLDGHRELPQV